MWEPVRELAHNAGFARTLAHGSEHLGDSGKYKNQLDMDPKQIQIRESHVADNSQKKGNPNQSDAHFVVCGWGEVARDETRLKLLFNRPRGVTDSILDSESSDRGSNPRETFWGCRSADCEVMQVSAAREPRIEPGSKKACVTATAQLVP